MIAEVALRITILDAPHGYQVERWPDPGCDCWNHWSEYHHEAWAYAAKLSACMGWPVDDLSTYPVENGATEHSEGAT